MPSEGELPKGAREGPLGDNSAAQLVSLDITSSTCEDKLYRMSKFAGAVCYNVLKICAALLSRTLRI